MKRSDLYKLKQQQEFLATWSHAGKTNMQSLDIQNQSHTNEKTVMCNNCIHLFIHEETIKENKRKLYFSSFMSKYENMK
jgi:hypothetical protein